MGVVQTIKKEAFVRLIIIYILAILMPLLSGCATNSGVVKIGEDTYKIYKRAATGFVGGSQVREAVLLEASEFCLRQGKVMKVIKIGGSRPPYILGNFPKATVHFMCLDPDDPMLKENISELNGGIKDDVETKLKTLNKLLADGLITKSEFEKNRAKLLNEYTNK